MANRFWVAGSGDWWDTAHWSTSSGGAGGASVPTTTDAVIVDANSGTPGITLNDSVGNGTGTRSRCGGINTTGSNCIFWLGAVGDLDLHGNANITSSSWNLSTVAIAKATLSVTCGGASFRGFRIFTAGTTTTLVDAFSCSAELEVDAGTFDASNQNVTARNVTVNTAVIMGSGTWTITGTTATVQWSMSSASTVNSNTSTLIFTGSHVGDHSFSDAANHSYHNVHVATTGAGAFLFSGLGSLTFSELKVNAGRTVKFTAGESYTVLNAILIGEPGNVITIGSITAASHELIDIGGGTIDGEYLSISRSTATPGSTWFANNSTDNLNNSGWIFSAPPPSALGNFFRMM